MSDSSEPSPKKKDIDPIVPSAHPWNLPAKVYMLSCSCCSGSGEKLIPPEANLKIDADGRRTVARVSQAVVAVASIDGDGYQLSRVSGFIIEFDEASMIGTILSSETVVIIEPGMPKIQKIRVYLFDGATYDATITARDQHWNLLVLSVLFDRAVQKVEMIKIKENRNARGESVGFKLQCHSDRESLYPKDIIIGLGRCSEDPFGLIANCGVYSFEKWAIYSRLCQELQTATFINTYDAIGGPAINKNGKVIGMLFHSLTNTPFLPSNVILKVWEHFKRTGEFCHPTIRIMGANLHAARPSHWENVPWPWCEDLDGILVEAISQANYEAGVRPNDLIVRCNGYGVYTNLQLFEILVENMGKEVELTVMRHADGSTYSICLPVQEAPEGSINVWPVREYFGDM